MLTTSSDKGRPLIMQTWKLVLHPVQTEILSGIVVLHLFAQRQKQMVNGTAELFPPAENSKKRGLTCSIQLYALDCPSECAR